MFEQLRQLVRRYASGEISYGDFRSDFVRFRAASDDDNSVERLYNNVESLCSAFDNQIISGEKLRADLLRRFFVHESAGNSNAVVAELFAADQSPVGLVEFASNDVNSLSPPSSSNDPEQVPSFTFIPALLV